MVLSFLILMGFLTARAEDRPRPMLERVIIDPGHGGEDPGITGPGGLTENRFTLYLARQLKAALENELGIKVVLTREEEDKNPTLPERTAVANAFKADIFLSLHAGSGPGDGAQSISVFYQSPKLQESLPRQGSGRDVSPEGARSWRLAQSRHVQVSARLAEELDQALREVLRVKTPGPIPLPLAVLTGADQPAVLIEIGLLTSAEGERRLGTEGYRTAVSQAVVRGLKSWQNWMRRLNGE
ncbi:MAG: N-acetylmuramoyl-L-alanine amidase [Pseudomonadota bacterium]